MQSFMNREDAGRRLASALLRESLRDPVVVAVPRGGVPVAYEIARALHAPLEVVLVRKLGAPYQAEFAIGAIADAGTPIVETDAQTMRMAGATDAYLGEEIARQQKILRKRRDEYGDFVGSAALQGKTAVLVDDGIATGATVRAALAALRQRRPASVILALPVASKEALSELQDSVDQVICLGVPAFFASVGAFYDDFRQVDDATVIALLRAARRHLSNS